MSLSSIFGYLLNGGYAAIAGYHGAKVAYIAHKDKRALTTIEKVSIAGDVLFIGLQGASMGVRAALPKSDCDLALTVSAGSVNILLAVRELCSSQSKLKSVAALAARCFFVFGEVASAGSSRFLIDSARDISLDGQYSAAAFDIVGAPFLDYLYTKVKAKLGEKDEQASERDATDMVEELCKALETYSSQEGDGKQKEALAGIKQIPRYFEGDAGLFPLVCPITKKPIRFAAVPNCAPSEHALADLTYEREAIEKWIQEEESDQPPPGWPADKWRAAADVVCNAPRVQLMIDQNLASALSALVQAGLLENARQAPNKVEYLKSLQGVVGGAS